MPVMPTLIELGLSTYYYATLPVRLGANACYAVTGCAPMCVLFYHRVSDSSSNAWTISHSNFKQHVRWLKSHCDLVSLSEIQNRMTTGYNNRAAVCITFDDGYSENCDFAIPHLLEQQIPLSYFVTLDLVLEGMPFPHDVQSGECLAVNTLAQLREMSAAGVDIGVHSRTHRDLGSLHHPECLQDEIVSPRKELQSLLGKSIDYFAFPYGKKENISDAAIRMVHSAGFRGFCSAYGGYNWPGDDPFHIQRIHGDPDLVRLKNWLTIDPRKMRIQRNPLPSFDPVDS